MFKNGQKCNVKKIEGELRSSLCPLVSLSVNRMRHYHTTVLFKHGILRQCTLPVLELTYNLQWFLSDEFITKLNKSLRLFNGGCLAMAKTGRKDQVSNKVKFHK